MINKFICSVLLFCALPASAERLLIPMDLEQRDHLRVRLPIGRRVEPPPVAIEMKEQVHPRSFT